MKFLSSAIILCTVVGASAGVWLIETVDSAGEVGFYASLALDNDENPCIVYQDQDNGDLKYAHWNGSSWDIETVDSDADVNDCTSLEIDAHGYPHISYFHRGFDYDLKYAHWNGSSWDIQTVDSDGMVGSHNSIAVDAFDNPHISYRTSQTHDLKYAAWNGSSWSIQTVDSAGDAGAFNCLALDSSGYPCISYYHASPGYDLKYAAWNGTGWDIETVDSAGEVGTFTSLALGSDDYPHISYRDSSNDSLKYAAWNGTGWDIETLDSQTEIGYYSNSIVLDSFDNPHIAYQDLTNLDLKYARYNQEPADFSLLSPADGATVGNYPLCDWENAIDPEGDVVAYDLWYTTQSDFSTYEEITGLTGSEYQFSDAELDPDNTYYWKVLATDGLSETWSTETWRFYVPDNVSIDGLELSVAPENNGLLLSWSVTGDTPSSVRVLRGESDPVAVSGSLPGETTRWLDRDVTPGESYVYWLEAT
ncbi:MAG: hypothetical protein GF403_03030, partial [Candidatus Coatesbacteria bacterium]|nr:hypothetical protein [Candidatus Coatesbacteria bacterium]